ncbi:hypothetical protein [Arenibacter sp. ARW7G5Y1]|uniref:hypothetical protein n=1 Tax=Arenibacter sp. ARW7G5Y1 TaxID=2135619 RepID=UPI000D75ED01|nr:hypothetical protein [Arenibacter sp. ARW7G5Y1]PXX31220.1 hypothetical protein C7972_10155 [Arenibacter sp. ARW7G5Y1]
MKKSMVFMALVATMVFTSCTPDTVRDSAEAFNSLECLNKLLKLSENEDDLSCSELVSALQGLKKSCGDEDGDIQEAINVIIANCED